jgi:hypothetical protein
MLGPVSRLGLVLISRRKDEVEKKQAITTDGYFGRKAINCNSALYILTSIGLATNE